MVPPATTLKLSRGSSAIRSFTTSIPAVSSEVINDDCAAGIAIFTAIVVNDVDSREDYFIENLHSKFATGICCLSDLAIAILSLAGCLVPALSAECGLSHSAQSRALLCADGLGWRPASPSKQ